MRESQDAQRFKQASAGQFFGLLLVTALLCSAAYQLIQGRLQKSIQIKAMLSWKSQAVLGWFGASSFCEESALGEQKQIPMSRAETSWDHCMCRHACAGALQLHMMQCLGFAPHAIACLSCPDATALL